MIEQKTKKNELREIIKQEYVDFYKNNLRFPYYNSIAKRVGCTREYVRQVFVQMEKDNVCYKPNKKTPVWFFK